MLYEDDEPIPMRRLPLLAHGSVTRPLILFLIAAAMVLVYGWFFISTPSEQDKRICEAWLHQYTERVNNAAIFEKAGCGFKGVTATAHGFYATVDIRTSKPCKQLPRPVDAYFSHNKLGMLMLVRLHAEGEDVSHTSYTSLNSVLFY